MDVTTLLSVVVVASLQPGLALVTIQLDEVALQNGYPACRLMPRSNATNQQNVWMFQGESLVLNFCLDNPALVSLDDFIYSNDGWQDSVIVSIDNEPLGEVKTHDTSLEGELWNIFSGTGPLGEQTPLQEGVHTLTVSVTEADKWGVELDSLVLRVQQNVNSDIDNMQCEGDYPTPAAIDDYPCGPADDAPIKRMPLSTPSQIRDMEASGQTESPVADTTSGVVSVDNGGSVTDTTGLYDSSSNGGTVTDEDGGSVTDTTGLYDSSSNGGTVTDEDGGSVTDTTGLYDSSSNGGTVTDEDGGSVTDTTGLYDSSSNGGTVTDENGGLVTDKNGVDVTRGGSVTDNNGVDVTSSGAVTDNNGVDVTSSGAVTDKHEYATKTTDIYATDNNGDYVTDNNGGSVTASLSTGNPSVDKTSVLDNSGTSQSQSSASPDSVTPSVNSNKNTSVLFSGSEGEDITIQRSEQPFCSEGLANYDIVSSRGSLMTISFTQVITTTLSVHASLGLANPSVLLSDNSAYIQAFPSGDDDVMRASVGQEDAVPCSAIQLSAVDVNGNMTSRMLLRDDGGILLFPQVDASRQAVFYPSQAPSGNPGLKLASVGISGNGSDFDMTLQTEFGTSRLAVAMGTVSTSITFFGTPVGGVTRLSSLDLPCVNQGEIGRAFVSADSTEFVSMFDPWQSFTGRNITLLTTLDLSL